MKASNVKAMREAVEYASRVLAKWQQDAPFSAWNEYGEAIDRCRAALAAPARNCDRFADELDAQLAFLNEVWLISVDRETMLGRDKYENWTDEMRARYGRWLLAPATEQKGGNDGSK